MMQTLFPVRTTDPETSSNMGDPNGSLLYVLDTLRVQGPLADHELVAFHARETASWASVRLFTPQRLRTARAELVDQGLVEATGYFRLTATGRRANVWQVVS